MDPPTLPPLLLLPFLDLDIGGGIGGGGGGGGGCRCCRFLSSVASDAVASDALVIPTEVIKCCCCGWCFCTERGNSSDCDIVDSAC